MKPGEPCPSGSKLVQATVTLPTSHKGHRKEAGAYFHPFTPAEKTVPSNQSVHSAGAQHSLAGPPGGQIHSFAFGFRQLAALTPPSWALTVCEIWVPRQLLTLGGPGFPIQRQLPCCPFLKRFVLTSGQFWGRHMQGLGNNVHLQTGPLGLRSGFPVIRQGGGNRRKGGSLHGDGGYLPPTGLLPPCLQSRGRITHRRHHEGTTALLPVT